MRTQLLNLAILLAPCALASTALAGPRELNTRFTYKTTVADHGGKPLDLWIPIPSDSEIQKVTNLKVTAPGDYRVTTESQYRNRMVYIHSDRPSGSFEVSVSCDVARMTGGVDAVRKDKGNVERFLAADRLVPIEGKFADIADSVVKGNTNAEKMRTIYDHVVATMLYDYKKESPKLGDGDVAFVCDYKKGNCSDLHSYVISLARAEGIPCYLEFGFPITGIPMPDPIPITGKIGGYHCWTWFYDDDKGWIVLDASDGRRWLDSNRPDQKEKLATQLVLERSAVAYSKGRDITLNPPQKGRELNNFIYPYAEAAGESVAAKWDITYERLSSGDVQEQIEELRKLVKAQADEIAALKAPAPKAQEPIVASTSEKVSVYGFVRTDAIFDSQHLNPNNQFPFFVKSPDDPNVGGRNNDQFTMHPRLSRLGLNLTAPGNTLPGWNVTGKVELDFQGGGSESRPTPRGRLFYAQLSRGTSTWQFGQNWDLISPLLPSPNDDSMMWNAGNLGDRRPQIRYMFDDPKQGTSFGLALGLSGAIDAKDLDGNGVRDGEDSGRPHLQARAGFKNKDVTFGVWGMAGNERTTKLVAGKTNFGTDAIGIDLNAKLGPMADLRGEWWSGRNLSDFRGGIGQGVDAATGKTIRSTGGWVELGFIPSPKHRIAFGYALDDPRDADVPAGGRTHNSAFYIHNKWTIGANLDLGLNFLSWATDYNGLRAGRDNRFNLFLMKKF